MTGILRLRDVITFSATALSVHGQTAAVSSSTSSPLPFVVGTGLCECDGLCPITTKDDCEAAALTVGHSDTSANTVDSSKAPPGCSINQGGGLRFNEDSSSTAPQNPGGVGPVLCQICEASTSSAMPMPDSCPCKFVQGQGICECTSGLCTLDSVAKCEVAAATVGQSDTTANIIDRSTQPRGCSINTKGGLRFNLDADSTTTQNPGNAGPVLCVECNTATTDDINSFAPSSSPAGWQCPQQFAVGRGLCECSGLCSITTSQRCEQAAALVGHSDVTANIISHDGAPPGCSINAGGGLRFNEDVSATRPQGPNGEGPVLCEVCNSGPERPDNCPAYRLEGVECDGDYYCPATSATECEAGAAELGVSDTTATVVDVAFAVPGCMVNGHNDLTFNVDGSQSTGHGRNCKTMEICVLCEDVETTASPPQQMIPTTMLAATTTEADTSTETTDSTMAATESPPVVTGDAMAPSTSTSEAKLPNFVIIFTDDLGINMLDLENPDLVGYQGRGHTITTPNLAQYFGHEGMTFQHWYSGNSVCSPSRAALLTGRQPVRVGIGIGEGGRERVFNRITTGGLPLNETTTATALKTAGYSTAIVGKWHLGNGKFHPTNHGFDRFYGLLHSHDMGKTFWQIDSKGPVALYNDSDIIEQPVDLSTIGLRFAAVAGDYVKMQVAQGNPFYLYMPMLHPHTPFRSAVQFCNISSEGARGDDLWEMDFMVGQVIEAITEAGVEDNTLVFFTSDNGGVNDPLGNLPLYGVKGNPWEGGMRVPSMARWPGKIPGGEVSHALTTTMDIHVTLLSLAGVPLESDRVYDGVDLSPLFLRESAESVEAFHQNNTKRCVMILDNAKPAAEYVNAVRCGDYKGHFFLKSRSTCSCVPACHIYVVSPSMTDHGTLLTSSGCCCCVLHVLSMMAHGDRCWVVSFGSEFAVIDTFE